MKPEFCTVDLHAKTRIVKQREFRNLAELTLDSTAFWPVAFLALGQTALFHFGTKYK
jgi:hypothetical protein